MASLALLISIFLLGMNVGCGTAPSGGSRSTPTSVSVYSSLFSSRYPVTLRANLSYGPFPQNTLDLCVPPQLSGPRPVVILIHGGGFVAGDKQYQFDEHDTLLEVCKGLASQGFAVASINYRLAADALWPSQVADAQLAVRWLRTHASDLQLDPGRLCTIGLSAGAYLSVFLGVLQSTHAGDQAQLLATVSPTVSCVVDFYGPVDLAHLLQTNPVPNQTVVQMLGYETPEMNPRLYHAASPLFFVSSKSAPTLIIHGTQDDIVPLAQSQALHSALQQNHIPVQLITYQGKHSLEGLNEQQIRGLWEQALAFLRTYESPSSKP